MIDVTGCQAIRPPEMSAPAAMLTPTTVPAADRARSTGTDGSSACAVSTYHASSGPESSARKTPWTAMAAKNTQKLWAAMNSPHDTRLATAEASRTGRRPSASANPPVGSSRPSTTKPCADRITPSWATLMPRCRAIRVSTPITRPTGNHRVALSRRKTRRAVVAESGVCAAVMCGLASWERSVGPPAAGAPGRGRAGRGRCRRRDAWPAGCPARPGGSGRAARRSRA